MERKADKTSMENTKVRDLLEDYDVKWE